MRTIRAFAESRAVDLQIARDAAEDFAGLVAVAVLFVAAFAVPSLM